MVSTEELNDMYYKVQKLLEHTDGKTRVASDNNIARVNWSSADESCLKFIVDFDDRTISLNVSKKGITDPIELGLNTDNFSFNNDLSKPLDLVLRHVLTSVSEDEFNKIEIGYLKVISEVTLQSRVNYLSSKLDALVASSKSNEDKVDTTDKEAQQQLFETLLDNIACRKYGEYLTNIHKTDINMGQELFDEFNIELLYLKKLDSYNYNMMPDAIFRATFNYAKHNGLSINPSLALWGDIK